MLDGELFLDGNTLKLWVAMGVAVVCQHRLNQGFKLGLTP